MNHEAWKKLYSDSSQLKKPARVQGLINDDSIAEIKILILSIINSFLEKGEVHIGLKTYINKELRNDMTDRMLAFPPKETDTLESWVQHIFQGDKFGMVMNYLEEYSNEFSQKAAEIVKPLLELAGLPVEGISFLFFMGNYGFTPFGIHKEAVGEEGVLFHLGPGNKDFYTWDDPKYNSMAHNKQVFHNIEEMLPEAQKYELTPGDAMLIPHQIYHVANTSDFSVSFVMDYINPPMDRFENQLIKDAGKLNISTQKTYQIPLEFNKNPSEWSDMLDANSIQKKIEMAFEQRILALKSNGGIKRKSNLNRKKHFPNVDFSISGKDVFPIIIKESFQKQDMIFARGHSFFKTHHTNLKKIIDRLNNGETLTFDDFKNALGKEWELTEIYGFIGDLICVEAIEIHLNN
jgi:hypothetical protein